jgi:ABC-type transporter Mla MlaB component
MLRITSNGAADGAPTLKLEGSIAGPWVSELRKVAQSSLAGSRTLKLDLSAVRFVDPAGAELLHELTQGSVEISGLSQFVAELLHGGNR